MFSSSAKLDVVPSGAWQHTGSRMSKGNQETFALFGAALDTANLGVSALGTAVVEGSQRHAPRAGS